MLRDHSLTGSRDVLCCQLSNLGHLCVGWFPYLLCYGSDLENNYLSHCNEIDCRIYTVKYYLVYIHIESAVDQFVFGVAGWEEQEYFVFKCCLVYKNFQNLGLKVNNHTVAWVLVKWISFPCKQLIWVSVLIPHNVPWVVSEEISVIRAQTKPWAQPGVAKKAKQNKNWTASKYRLCVIINIHGSWNLLLIIAVFAYMS